MVLRSLKDTWDSLISLNSMWASSQLDSGNEQHTKPWSLMSLSPLSRVGLPAGAGSSLEPS